MKLPPIRLSARTSPESNSPLDGIVASETLGQFLLPTLRLLGDGVLLLLFNSYRAFAACRRFCCSTCNAADAGPIDAVLLKLEVNTVDTSSDLIFRRRLSSSNFRL